jgi:hypothetical protein
MLRESLLACLAWRWQQFQIAARSIKSQQSKPTHLRAISYIATKERIARLMCEALLVPWLAGAGNGGADA